jgi:hypothetical protein
MIGWALQWTIISLILIMLVHYLYSFFINTLTVPKVRDMINKPTERYNEILSQETQKSQETPVVDTNEMQAELRDFLSNIKKGDSGGQGGIISANEAEGYSSY